MTGTHTGFPTVSDSPDVAMVAAGSVVLRGAADFALVVGP